MIFLIHTLYSITLSQCSSLIVRDQVSHSCRTKGKIIFVHVLSSHSQIRITQGGKRLWTNRWQGLPEFKFFRHAILIYWCRSQLFELGHICKGFISCLSVAMLVTLRSVPDRTRTPSYCECYKYFHLIQPHYQQLDDPCYKRPTQPSSSVFVHAASSVGPSLLCI